MTVGFVQKNLSGERPAAMILHTHIQTTSGIDHAGGGEGPLYKQMSMMELLRQVSPTFFLKYAFQLHFIKTLRPNCIAKSRELQNLKDNYIPICTLVRRNQYDQFTSELIETPLLSLNPMHAYPEKSPVRINSTDSQVSKNRIATLISL